MKFWVPAGVAFVFTGVLEVMFLALSVLGTLLGGAMSVGSLMGELRNEEAVLGPVIFLFYGLWLTVTAIAGPLHLFAGGSILMGRRNRKLLWAATIVSLLPVVTVYCAPTSLLAGGLGLVAALLTTPPPADASAS